ncbi:MAG: serine/threonine protein kinase [Myxococcales bacterium]|nr:serine/threonine protein kinase [Myxococcales bacterium]
MTSISEDLKGVTLLGKYELERPLGEGGMGTVWLGKHKLMGRQVAIKLLDDALLNHSEVVQRFGREARAASAIQHPGIVEVLDLDQTPEGRPFLVMEFLQGEPLSSRIEKRGRLSPEEAAMFMGQLLEALDAAHAHGVVHRDLKPDNIFLVPRGRGGESVKILDFGISHKSDERVSKLTVQGTVLGTPHYMAPEQARGDAAVDGRTDIYAAGVVFYECVVGTVPFDAPNYNALLHMILTDEPESPSDRGVAILPRLERVIMRAMSKRREDRPQTAGGMLAEIKAAFTPSDDDDDGAAPGPASDTLSDALKPSNPAAVPNLDLDLPTDMPSDLAMDLPSNQAAAAPQAAARSSGEQELTLDPEFGEVGASVDRARPEQLEVPEAPPQGRVIPWQLKAAGIGVVGIATLVMVMLGIKYMLNTTPPPQPDREAEEEVVQEARPAALSTVEVALRGVPDRASVKLDGFPPANLPFRVRAGSHHVVEVDLDGYEPWRIEFDAPTNQERMALDVSLRPVIGGGSAVGVE